MVRARAGLPAPKAATPAAAAASQNRRSAAARRDDLLLGIGDSTRPVRDGFCPAICSSLLLPLRLSGGGLRPGGRVGTADRRKLVRFDWLPHFTQSSLNGG